MGRDIQKVLALLLSGFICYLGYRLFLAGVGGTASLMVEHDSFKAQLVNATPGALFMLGGVVLAVLTVRARERRQSRVVETDSVGAEGFRVQEILIESSAEPKNQGEQRGKPEHDRK